MDRNNQAGNDAEVWRFYPFEEDDVIDGTVLVSGSPSSDNADIVANGDNNVIVLPPQSMYLSGDISTTTYLYRSINGGDTFTKETRGTYHKRVMAGSNGRMYLAFLDDADDDLKVSYYSTLTATAPTSTTTLLASTFTTSDLVAVGTPSYGSNYVLIAYADVSIDTIGFFWSTLTTPSFSARTSIIIPDAATMAVEALEIGAIDSSTVTVFWRQSGTIGGVQTWRIYFDRSTNGGTTWTGPHLLHDANENQTTPYVADTGVLAADGNDAYSMEFHVTYEDFLNGATRNLYATVGGDTWPDNVSSYYNKFFLDREFIAQSSLDMVSSDYGHYVVYQSTPPPPAALSDPDYSKIEMQFCHVHCHEAVNWYRQTLKRIDPYNSANFRAASVAVSSTGKIYVTYRQGTGGAKLKILRGGRMYRYR
jgi:hypothetical protein